MLDIPTNHLGRYFAANTSDKIAIVPQFPTPQLLLYLRKLLKYYAGGNTFQPLDDLNGTIAWWYRPKDMHMIVQYLLRIDFKTILFSNLLKNHLQSIRYSLVQNQATIFGDPYHMVFVIADSTSGWLQTHAWKNSKLSALRRLALFLPPANWGYPRAGFYES